MPHNNQFQHQSYHAAPPATPYEVVESPQSIRPEDAEYSQALVRACEGYRDTQLAAVFLVHGTFTGNDLLGVLTELKRCSPWLAERLRRISKRTVDLFVDETGNYTKRYAETFEQGLLAGCGRKIPVELFHWSSQNNHIARADGAVRLIAKLADFADSIQNQLDAERPPRVMLWAHSHGGNVLALVSNLLAADTETRQAFFDAARVFYTPWLRKRADMPGWERVEKLLSDAHPVRRLKLDMVTFGTPIRYGWDSHGYGQLLHFVNHRPTRHLPHHRTHFPLHPLNLLSARHGDYVHQIGIAGTNMIPLPLAVRTFLADRRLQSVLQPDVTWVGLMRRYLRGQRVHDEGPTLLVDYDDRGWRFWHHLFGHAAYTRRCWLPFHLDEIAKRFYSDTNAV